MPDETELPSELALLWGLRDAPKRGPKPALTVHEITRAAVAIADAEGLDAVSMAKVASHLGNATMALYRHVKSKNELLTLMGDAALEQPPELPPDGHWRDNMLLWAKAVHGAIERHPWHTQLPIKSPPFGPNSLLWFDRALGTLSNVDLSEEEKTALVMGLMTYVRGGYIMALQLAEGYAENPASFSPQHGDALRKLVDPRVYPALSKVVAAGVFDVELWDAEEDNVDFEFGLNVYLDGIAAYIARRTT